MVSGSSTIDPSIGVQKLGQPVAGVVFLFGAKDWLIAVGGDVGAWAFFIEEYFFGVRGVGALLS